jgi:dCTP deaminase
LVVISDKDIFRRLLKKEITIHPILDARQIQGAKIDLRLGNVVYIIRHFAQPCYDPRVADTGVEYGEERFIGFCRAEERKGFILQPGDFAIAPLFERVRIPQYMIGRLDGRSSLGRLGLVIHATAGGIDPGYAGHITCELSNLGKVPIALHPLQRIASLTLETLSEEATSAYRKRGEAEGKYSDQLTTKLREDKEFTASILDKVAEML